MWATFIKSTLKQTPNGQNIDKSRSIITCALHVGKDPLSTQRWGTNRQQNKKTSKSHRIQHDQHEIQRIRPTTHIGTSATKFLTKALFRTKIYSIMSLSSLYPCLKGVVSVLQETTTSDHEDRQPITSELDRVVGCGATLHRTNDQGKEGWGVGNVDLIYTFHKTSGNAHAHQSSRGVGFGPH